MLKKPNMERFCDMYFRGDDWAKANDFPTLELLRNYKAETEKYGLLVDYTGKAEPYNERLVFFGNSNAEVEIKGFSVVKIIARHNSRVKVTVSDYAVVYIDKLDHAMVEVVNKSPNATVRVYEEKSPSNGA